MKVSELEGESLRLWVARAIGLNVEKGVVFAGEWFVYGEGGGHVKIVDGRNGSAASFAPDLFWSQGGPLIDSERIMIDGDLTLSGTTLNSFEWSARVYGEGITMVGPTPLIAAMRALVASKFGEEVSDE